jgi:hypothetical protein
VLILEIGEVEHGVVVHGCGLDEVSPLGTHWVTFFTFVTSFVFCVFAIWSLSSLMVRLLFILVTSSIIHHRFSSFYTVNILHVARPLSMESLIISCHSAELLHCSCNTYFQIFFHDGYFLIRVLVSFFTLLLLYSAGIIRHSLSFLLFTIFYTFCSFSSVVYYHY